MRAAAPDALDGIQPPLDTGQMSFAWLLSLAGFSVATSITPGPNNMMLLASGVNFGFARSLRHVAGISFGFLVLLLAVGTGIGAALEAYPQLHRALTFAGAAYLAYLAYRIAATDTLHESQGNDRPMTFLEAALFQWVNPKAWVMAVTGMAVYGTADRPFLGVAVIALVFAALNAPSVAVWAGLGAALRDWLAEPTRLKWFNRAMGALLLLSVAPMVL